MQTEGYEEEEEEPVVPPSYAVVHPRAMVVKCLQKIEINFKTRSHSFPMRKEVRIYLYQSQKYDSFRRRYL